MAARLLGCRQHLGGRGVRAQPPQPTAPLHEALAGSPSAGAVAGTHRRHSGAAAGPSAVAWKYASRWSAHALPPGVSLGRFQRAPASDCLALDTAAAAPARRTRSRPWCQLVALTGQGRARLAPSQASDSASPSSNCSVAVAAGRGSTLSDTSHSTASTPIEPAIRRDRS